MMRHKMLLTMVIFGVASFLALARIAPKSELPKINVIFLDHSAAFSKSQGEVVRNDWSVWNKRLPHFIPALQDVATFRIGQSGKYQREASLFSILLSDRLSLTEQKEILIREINEIYRVTQRPSCILTRSTTGHDQLSIVFQDNRDYPPEVATEMVIQLGKFGPPSNAVVWPKNCGPFQPPPTIIVDYRTNPELRSKDLGLRAKSRWGILESGYLLPEYVLHAIVVLNDSIMEDTGTFYRTSKPDLGAGLIVDTPLRKTAYFGMLDRYGPLAAGEADLFGVMGKRVDSTSGIHEYLIEPGLGMHKGISRWVSEDYLRTRVASTGYFGHILYGPLAPEIKSSFDLKGWDRYGASDIGKLPSTKVGQKWVLKELDFGLGVTISPAGVIPGISSLAKFGPVKRTFFTKPGGILFEVGNDYKVDPTGKVSLYAKLSKKAKEGKFEAEDKTYRTVSIPLGKSTPMEVGWCKLTEVEVLDDPLGRLPLAIPRLYGTASGIEGSVGKDWTFDFAEINFDTETIVPVDIDEHKLDLPFEITFVEQETGAELLYDLSYCAGTLKSGEGSAVLYGATQSVFQPDLIAKQDGTYEVCLAHGTSITFNADGQPIALKDRSGNTIQFSHKGKEIMSITASNGRQFKLKYKNSKLVRIDAGRNTLASYQYNTKGLLSKVTTQMRNTRYGYDSEGRIVRISNKGLGSPFLVLYDDTNRVKELSAREKMTKITYDDRKRLIKLIWEDGSAVQWKLNSGNYLMSIFEDRHEILLSRDPHGRLLQMAWGIKKKIQDVEVTHIHKVLGTRKK